MLVSIFFDVSHMALLHSSCVIFFAMFVIYLLVHLIYLLGNTTLNNLLFVIAFWQDWPIKGGQPLLRQVKTCDLFLTG